LNDQIVVNKELERLETVAVASVRENKTNHENLG
jgi:hypothetical protein